MGKPKLPTAAAPPDRTPAAGNVMPITSGRKRVASGHVADPGDTAQSIAPTIVVLGLDDGGRAHASWLGVADAELAIKAAGRMGFSVLLLQPTNTTQQPQGSLQAGSSRRVGAFAPFAKKGAYESLKAFGEAYQPPTRPEPQFEPPLEDRTCRTGLYNAT